MIKDTAIHTEMADSLLVRVYANRQALGEAAAMEAAIAIRALLASKRSVRIIFAAAPSQNEFLDTLALAPDIDWTKVTAFHMDEYTGLPAGAPQLFGTYLRERLFDRVQPGVVHYIQTDGDLDGECKRYGELLAQAPIDIVCLGIGENGHLAFNDPPVADFHDPVLVKAVTLDSACRGQQVNDGCFATLDAVPLQALTLTIPTLLSAKWLFCMVPGSTKQNAVARTLREPITTDCPSTILRTHTDCRLFIDKDSYGSSVPD
ncbi:glucosamine-6-phosphate deaminase [Paenibacillus sp. 19GGS1-52]|uniref:glucosamine-6-phosphate deaminase n=1 Tax=Paenibacillus sp. 19GGS1-52 TaxID=2758563 RepID=UPI001EFC0E4B|nr:glucosamine-6-phosphate deaminase [Paenibacillus sp. 19GGS1-52]ULO05802.1 glucosamine-6-phosphate deaminase [Paenibacillus sp. 19GGS1-52]